MTYRFMFTPDRVRHEGRSYYNHRLRGQLFCNVSTEYLCRCKCTEPNLCGSLTFLCIVVLRTCFVFFGRTDFLLSEAFLKLTCEQWV